MDFRKGISNSSYAVITSAALITGLMLLSNLGNPYSIAGKSGSEELQSVVDEQGDLDLPEGAKSRAEDYLETQDIEQQGITDNRDLMKVLSNQFSNLLSKGKGPGQKKSQSGNFTREGNQSKSGNKSRSGNETVEQPEGGNGTAPGEPGEGNLTAPEEGPGNETDTGGDDNDTEPSPTPEPPGGDNQTDGGSENQTEPDKPGEDSGPEEINESGSGSGKGSSGFIQGLIESLISSLQPGSDNQSSETKESNQEEPEQQSQEGNKGSDGSSKQGIGGAVPGIGNLNTILYAALLAGSVILVILFYRSDKEGGELLKEILERLRDAFYALPDIFKRSVVKSVSFLIYRSKKFLRLLKRTISKPVATLENASEALRTKAVDFKAAVGRMLSRSLKENIKIILEGEGPVYKGIDRIWQMLKSLVGVGTSKTLTPAEIREKAISQGMPKETVDEIVSAFRRQKYSSEEPDADLDVEELRDELEGEKDG